MAAPARPAIVDEGGQLKYQSLDNVDQTLYDGLKFQYERTAFIVALEDELSRIARGNRPAFADGNAVLAEWNRRRAYLTNKWRKKGGRRRPIADAAPPLPAVPAYQPAAPPVQPTPVLPPPVLPPPVLPPAVSSPPNVTQAEPESPETLVGGSHPFALLNSWEYHVLPTRGDIATVRDQMKDQGWKFVRVLYQTEMEPEDPVDGRADLHPFKNVLLYVLPDENGLIMDQVVVKRIYAKSKSKIALAQNEITANERLEALGCSHIIRFRGSGERTTRKRTIPWDERPDDEQRIFHLYTEFAQYGDLNAIIKAHAKKEQPIPEHFVWHYLSQIIEALLALREGRCCDKPPDMEPADADVVNEGDQPEASVDWEPLLHADIKPQNIFCAKDNGKYPSYPRVLLADFDSLHKENSDRHRNLGTDGWQPPEKFGKHADKNYFPKTWPLTQKSDAWTVGLVAHRLLWAGKGNNDLCEITKYMEYRMGGWAIKFTDTALIDEQNLGSLVDAASSDHKVHTNDILVSEKECGHGASVRTYDISDHEQIYSIGLIRFIRDCLQYHPDERLSLRKMKEKIDSAITRLDGLYAEEIKKSREATSKHHEVLVEEEKWAEFDLGKRYEPPRKRRRVSVDPKATNGSTYIKHVEAWPSISTQPTLEQQAQAILAVEKWFNLQKSKHHFKEGPHVRDCFQYLRSCILHRVAPDEPTHVITRWETVEKTAFTPGTIAYLARLITQPIVRELLEDESISELHDSLRVLSHAAKWAELLVACNGEPRTPLLDDKTELHRGFRDWVMMEPYYKNHFSSGYESS